MEEQQRDRENQQQIIKFQKMLNSGFSSRGHQAEYPAQHSSNDIVPFGRQTMINSMRTNESAGV